MKKVLFLSSLLAYSITSYSQVTFTNTDLPSAGDTVLVSSSNQFTDVDLVATGANQTWNFSFLAANTQTIDTFFTPPNVFSTYGLVFNNPLTPNYDSDYYNNLTGSAIPEVPGGVVTIENPVFFTKNSNSKSEIVGLGMEINGIQVPAKADTIDMVYQLPMTFNDNWTSRSYIYLDLNPAFNGIFKRHQYRTSVVDGWGQITTPYGTFDAVRVMSTVTYTDSVYFELIPGVGTWNEIPTPTDVEYTWLANSNKIPVLKIVAQEGIATSIVYRDHLVNDFMAIESNNEPINFAIYPNPAQDVVSISFLESDETIIEVLDVTGKLIYSNTVSMSNNHSINISSWNKGIYMVRLIKNEAVTTKSFVVK